MTLLAALCCNTLMVLPVALLARLLTRRAPPALVHALWLLILVKLVTPPLVRMPLPRLDWSIPSMADEVLEPADAPPADADPAVATTGQEYLAPPARVDAGVATGLHFEEVAFPERSVPPAAADPAPAGFLGPPPVESPAPFQAASWWQRRSPQDLFLVWLAGAVTCLGLLARQSLRFRRTVRGLSEAPEAWRQEVARLARRMGLRRLPRVLVTERRCPPLVWAPGRAVHLVLPRGLFRSLNADQRTSLLLHELAHLRRGDHRVRLLELAVRVLHWCNPIAWWAMHELRDAEEEACDAWVTAVLPHAAGAYSEALVRTAEFLSHAPRIQPVAASGLGRVPALKRRLQMIFRGSRARSIGPWGRGGVAMAALMTLPLFPVFAQQETRPQDDVLAVVQDALAGLPNAPAATPQDPTSQSRPANARPRSGGPIGLGGGPEARPDALPPQDNPFRRDEDPREMAQRIERAVILLREMGHPDEAAAVLSCARQLAQRGGAGPRGPGDGPSLPTGADGRFDRGGVVYEVQPGDTLERIAQKLLGSHSRWEEIARANDVRGRDLRVGQRLIIPGATQWQPGGQGPSGPTRDDASDRTRPDGRGPSGPTRDDARSAQEDRLESLERQVRDLSRAVEALARSLGGAQAPPPPDGPRAGGPSRDGPGAPGPTTGPAGGSTGGSGRRVIR